MFKNNKTANAVRLALIAGAATTAFSFPSAYAAEDENEVERIEVTGSAISRTDMEGALPITLITQEDIVRTGVTSVPDLVAQIPQMQGFTTAGESVGGGGWRYPNRFTTRSWRILYPRTIKWTTYGHCRLWRDS